MRNVQLHQGDCLQFLQSLPSASIDAIITDPPYNSGGASSASRTGQNTTKKYQQSGTRRAYVDFGGDNRDQRGFAFWCHLWLSECHRVAKEGAPILLFTDWRQLPLTTDLLQAADFIWRGVAVWDKTPGCRPTFGRFAAQSEFIVWGSKGAMPRERGVATLPGVFSHMVRQSDKHHLTGKPTPLMEDLVKIIPSGGVILDPFAGSGTTGVAALRHDCDFVGIEREAFYADLARNRLQELSALFGQ